VGVGKLLPLFVAVPLGVGFIMPLLDKLRRERILDAVAIVTSLFLFVLTVVLLTGGGDSVYWMGDWKPRLLEGKTLLGICLVSDGLSRLLVLIVNAVAFLVVIFSSDYMKRYTSRGLFYSLFFLMVAGMNGVVLTGDFFNLYVFLEVASISSYALVAFGCESEELEASFKYLVLGAIGTLLVLTGVALLYGLTGTLNMGQVAKILASGETPMKPAYLALGLFLAGFGVKAAMVPFHAWLPDAHPSAPAPISAMLSGVLIKAVGVYVLCRIVFNVFALTPHGAHVLMALGIISMVAGGFLMVGQWDLKRLLAYSSISHMGYVVLAVGLAAVPLQWGHRARRRNTRPQGARRTGQAHAHHVGLHPHRLAQHRRRAALQRVLVETDHRHRRRVGRSLLDRRRDGAGEFCDAGDVRQGPAIRRAGRTFGQNRFRP